MNYLSLISFTNRCFYNSSFLWVTLVPVLTFLLLSRFQTSGAPATWRGAAERASERGRSGVKTAKGAKPSTSTTAGLRTSRPELSRVSWPAGTTKVRRASFYRTWVCKQTVSYCYSCGSNKRQTFHVLVNTATTC